MRGNAVIKPWQPVNLQTEAAGLSSHSILIPHYSPEAYEPHLNPSKDIIILVTCLAHTAASAVHKGRNFLSRMTSIVKCSPYICPQQHSGPLQSSSFSVTLPQPVALVKAIGDLHRLGKRNATAERWEGAVWAKPASVMDKAYRDLHFLCNDHVYDFLSEASRRPAWMS